MDYISSTLIKSDLDSESFYYGDYYVTNKEYITYLIWTKFVHYNTPDEFWNAFPFSDSLKFKSDIDDYDEYNHKVQNVNFDSVLYSLPDFISGYVFNPEYKDKPVIGITYEQGTKYLNWLTDRYNEHALIKTDYLAIDPNQIGDENFNLEACIDNQYEGLVNKPIYYKSIKLNGSITWEDNVLRPSFHFPIYTEQKKIKLSSNYKKVKNHWIETFWNIYSSEKEDYSLCNFYLQNKSNFEYHIDSINYWLLEPTLSYTDNGLKLLDVFCLNQQCQFKFDSIVQTEWTGKTHKGIQKDSVFGRLPYMLLKNNKKNEPIYVTRYQKDIDTNEFRLVISPSNSVIKINNGSFSKNIGIVYTISGIKKSAKTSFTPDVFDYNESFSHSGTCLHSSYWRTNFKKHRAFKTAIKFGLDINQQDINGETLLHQQTSYSGDFRTLKILIKSGADCSLKNKMGKTPYEELKRKQYPILRANRMKKYLEKVNCK